MPTSMPAPAFVQPRTSSVVALPSPMSRPTPLATVGMSPGTECLYGWSCEALSAASSVGSTVLIFLTLFVTAIGLSFTGLAARAASRSLRLEADPFIVVEDSQGEIAREVATSQPLRRIHFDLVQSDGGSLALEPTYDGPPEPEYMPKDRIMMHPTPSMWCRFVMRNLGRSPAVELRAIASVSAFTPGDDADATMEVLGDAYLTVDVLPPGAVIVTVMNKLPWPVAIDFKPGALDSPGVYQKASRGRVIRWKRRMETRNVSFRSFTRLYMTESAEYGPAPSLK